MMEEERRSKRTWRCGRRGRRKGVGRVGEEWRKPS